MCVSSNNNYRISFAGNLYRTGRIAPIVINDLCLPLQCFLEPLEWGDHIRRASVRRSTVASVWHSGEFADHRQLLYFFQWQQCVLVLQQNDCLFRRLTGDLAVRFAANYIQRIFLRVTALSKTDLLAQHAQRSIIDPLDWHFSALHQAFEVLPVNHVEGHLDILSGQRGFPGIAHAEDEVGHHKALEAPLLLENLGEQHVVLPAPLAIDAVIGAHDRSNAFFHGALEMAQVDLVERARRDGHIHAEAGVFHRIQGVMLGAGHHVLLHAAHQSSPKFAQVHGIFAVGFLCAPPGRMSQQVDTYAAEEIPTHRAQFAPNYIAHPFFQLRVKGGSTAHGNREGGAAIHDHPTRAIRETYARDAQTRHRSGNPGMVCVTAPKHISHA